MIRNTNYFDLIEDYCHEQLDEETRLEFETELKRNPELKIELELWKDIQGAIEEKEILTLRDKLENVAKENKPKALSNDSFDLLDEFSDIQEINEILSSEELINFYDSLPKVHVYQHQKTSNENIHQFYKEQKKTEFFDIEDEMPDADLEEFEGLEEAILEKDILQFRQTLKQVAKSIEPQYSVEEIDNYINGELSGSELFEFENDLLKDRTLKEELKLHKDINAAIEENDIMSLRGQISNILQTETSWNVSEQSIEEYIDGVLEGEDLEEFKSELADNLDLAAEVELRRNVNSAINEKDIFELRRELAAARATAETNKVKMLIPESKSDKLKFLRTSVAVVIVLLGLTGVLRNSLVSTDHTYENYYTSPSWSAERALTDEVSILQKANTSYMASEYDEVIQLLSIGEAGATNPVFDFYRAASFQNLEKFEDAIAGYTRVIENGDNLFIEEAEWYRGLCYLKLGELDKARNELLAVIERKGHFEEDAKAVIRRLKYSAR
jgi:anti-sigma factor RsiW